MFPLDELTTNILCGSITLLIVIVTLLGIAKEFNNNANQ